MACVMLHQVTGSLSSLTEVGVGLLVAVIIAMVSSWILAVLVLVFIPVLVAAGLIQVWLTGSRLRGSRQHSSPVRSPSPSGGTECYAM